MLDDPNAGLNKTRVGHGARSEDACPGDPHALPPSVQFHDPAHRPHGADARAQEV